MSDETAVEGYKPGRPTLLTDDLRKRLLDLVELGAPVDLCAQGAGISESAFYGWMARGRREQDRIEKGGEPLESEAAYLTLNQEVTDARLKAATRNVAAVQKAVQGGAVTEETVRTFRDHDGQTVTEKTVKRQAPDWRAASWFLERQFARYYGKTNDTNVTVTGADGGPIQVQADATALSKRLAEHLATATIPAALEAAAGADEADDDVHDAELVED